MCGTVQEMYGAVEENQTPPLPSSRLGLELHVQRVLGKLLHSRLANANFPVEMQVEPESVLVLLRPQSLQM